MGKGAAVTVHEIPVQVALDSTDVQVRAKIETSRLREPRSCGPVFHCSDVGRFTGYPLVLFQSRNCSCIGVYRKDPQQGGSVFRQPICGTVTTGMPVESVKRPETN